MPKAMHLCILFLWALNGCGPDTIFVRPELDTPAQHVSNGNQLLDQAKWEDAGREFERARDLDPYYTEAWIGLAVAYGGRGDTEIAFRMLDDARRMAASPEEHAQIDRAAERLHRMSKGR